jgi:hypothetical protein
MALNLLGGVFADKLGKLFVSWLVFFAKIPSKHDISVQYQPKSKTMEPPAAVFLSSSICFYSFTFTSEHFRVSNLINHVALRIKVKKKYSEWIWRFEAREGKKVKYICNADDGDIDELKRSWNKQ